MYDKAGFGGIFMRGAVGNKKAQTALSAARADYMHKKSAATFCDDNF